MLPLSSGSKALHVGILRQHYTTSQHPGDINLNLHRRKTSNLAWAKWFKN